MTLDDGIKIGIAILVGGLIIGLYVACVTAIRRVEFWRIKWIELEHDTARTLGREPRDIKTVENEPNKY